MGLIEIFTGGIIRNILGSIVKDGPIGPIRARVPLLFKSPVENLVESFVDNVIRDKVTSPALGSVVYCELAIGHAEHSGIYVGGNSIVHLDGEGTIEKVTPSQFMERLGGFNTAISIYVSCNNGNPVGSVDVADRARNMVGRKRDYNLFFDNCHQFTAGCLTGRFENSSNFFFFLKNEATASIDCTEWRVWDL